MRARRIVNLAVLRNLRLVLVTALISVPVFVPPVAARGGGGFGGVHDDGGFGGGSFRGEDAMVVGPDGGVAARGPDGGAVVRGPNGGVAVRRPITPDGDYYYGGDGDYYDAAGTAVSLVVGTAVASLSSDATTAVVAGQTYYLDDGIYYQLCYQGAVESYCVVSPP